MEHKNWVTKDENIWKPQIRCEHEQKFRNCLGIKIFFFKLSGSTTQRTRRQRWTTQSLGRQSKNLAALKYPHLQGDSILSKKGKRCKMYIIDSTTFDFQFGEYAAIWGLREQADSNENLQYQLYLHLWPYMVRHFFLYIDDGNAQAMSKRSSLYNNVIISKWRITQDCIFIF